jgi:hypothetical protein
MEGGHDFRLRVPSTYNNGGGIRQSPDFLKTIVAEI